MSLTPEIIALLTLDAIFLFLGLIALFASGRIALWWDNQKSTPLQYTLSKQSYLVSTIIKYIFMLKLPLFLFFIYTCDKLSSIIAGAMCASGVVNSVDFGLYLTLFKLLNLYLFGFWLLLHYTDINNEKLPYTRLKFALFVLFSLPLFAEIGLEIAFFVGLNISKIVSCCGTLFSATSSSYISLFFVVDELLWVGGFYGFFALSIVAFRLKNTPVMIFANSMFLIFSIISLIVFFSPYVYELPTHRCPFCLLQKEYYYVGYLLYTLLFAGTFYGIGGGALALLSKKAQPSFMKASICLNMLYLAIISSYPLIYYVKNGVWL
ncbi:hypothetical protein [Sulfurospirillum arsenophilum]|uniref:hypothetical protein n=1 Tax=Sulfurospirillum arsenophilum TaxID=56698 RepID=UPI0005AB50B6|nr:hypothetical protein [Sulfurospirillum arsenophilum]